jgi:hypothetical protein
MNALCNDPPPWGPGTPMLGSSLGPQEYPHRPTHVFLRTLSSLMCTREGLPGRSPIAPCQAHLTMEFFVMGFRKRIYNLLVWVSLSILLSIGPGCHTLPPPRSRLVSYSRYMVFLGRSISDLMTWSGVWTDESQILLCEGQGVAHIVLRGCHEPYDLTDLTYSLDWSS